MAITTYQTPGSVSHYMAGSVYPEWYTCISSYAAAKADFKYVFKTYAPNKTTTTSELISNTKNYPRSLENLGSFNVTPIVSSLVQTTFQPTITTWTPCPDSIRQYAVEVSEYYDGIFQSGSTTKYGKSLMFKHNYENFPWSSYILNNTTGKKFLTDKSQPTKIRLSDYGTLRMINASVIPSNYTTYVSQPYSINFDFFTGNGQEKYIYTWSITNPYWYSSIPLDNSTPYVFDNHTTRVAPRLLDIPVGPKNFDNLTLNLLWLIGSDGTAVAVNPPYATPASQVFRMGNIKYYEVYAYTWPIGEVSKRYRYELTCENSRKPAIQIQWENNQGGIDNFLFDKVYTKTNSIESINMMKNKYQQGHSSTWSTNRNYYIGSNAYDRGVDRIYNEQITTYVLNTDFLSQAQCSDIESLWQSNAIYANIEGTFYPVVSLTDKQTIKTTMGGTLRQYQFEIQVANNKYNY